MSTVTNTPGRLVRLTCHCDLAAVRDVGREVRSFLEQEGLTPAEVSSWELVCAEAGNNAVEYAAGTATRLPVEFVVDVTATAVELRVYDHTPGFDLPPESTLPDPLDEGGRGLFLMRSLTDDLQYWRGKNHNCLVARRQRLADPLASSRVSSSVEQSMLQATLHTMTEELATSYEILSAIFRFTEELNQSAGDTAFIERWLTELQQITGADWYVLRLVNPTGSQLDVSKTSHRGVQLPPLPLDDKHAQTLKSVELAVMRNPQDSWFDANAPLAQDDPLSRLGTSLAGFSHPLTVAGEKVGVLTIGRYALTHSFSAGQVNIIHTLTDFLAIQIRNAQFQAGKLKAQLLERDYEVASRIQKQLLPKAHPRRGRWGTLGFCESAQRVGGDFYDIIEVGSRGLLLAIADVMGKGLPAALFATVFRTLLHARPDLARSPSAFVEWLNQNLVAELGGMDMIITAQLAYVNFESRELRVAGAGHPPLIIAGRDGYSEEVLSSGPPLGIDEALAFDEEKRTLPEGARLLLYTDGVTEATDAHGSQLGTTPLRRILAASASENHSLEQTVAHFAQLRGATNGSKTAADDQTLLLLLEDLSPHPALQ